MPDPTPPRSVRGAVLRGLRAPVAFAAGAAATLGLAAVVLGVDLGGAEDQVVVDSVAEEDAVARDRAADSRATRLMRLHDCWSGEAPSDVVVPGHVVLTQRLDGALVTSHGGERLVGRALEALFGEGDARVVTVHGFCR